MITPFDMAKIYWSRQKKHSIVTIEKMIESMSSTSRGREYWNEVLFYLKSMKTAKETLQ